MDVLGIMEAEIWWEWEEGSNESAGNGGRCQVSNGTRVEGKLIGRDEAGSCEPDGRHGSGRRGQMNLIGMGSEIWWEKEGGQLSLGGAEEWERGDHYRSWFQKEYIKGVGEEGRCHQFPQWSGY